MTKDANERALALNPTRSFIVQAPAGSGKTELLTQRFLKLLAYVDAPEEILAVTFTRKAASQMRQRIMQALQQGKIQQGHSLKEHEKTTAQLARSALQRDQQLQWQLLDNPNRLRILTIDALNALIVNRMPILAHLGGMPEIVEAPQEFYQQAVQALFQQTDESDPWCQSLSKLLLHEDNRIEKITEMLVLMLGKRDQWLPYIKGIENTGTDIYDYLQQALHRIITSHLAAVIKQITFEQASELISLLNYAATECLKAGIENAIIQCEDLNVLPPSDIQALPGWQGIVELLLTQQNTWRKSFNVNMGFPSPQEGSKEEKAHRKAKKEQAQQLVAQLGTNDQLLMLLTEIRLLPPVHIPTQQIEILAALADVLPVLVAHLQLVFQEKGKVDFIEVNLRALQALGEELAPTEIALQLDYQIQHILIDEYQDTSVTQYKLFEKLVAEWQPGEGKTLFLVGDPMQSIYRFRGAEVSLFMHTQQHGLGNIKLTPLNLVVNFRSTSNIVSWVNHTFSQVFPQQADKTLGSVSFAPALAHLEVSPEQAVFFHPLMLEDDQSTYIIKLIQDLLAQNPQNHIAILARTRKHLAPIIEKLKKSSIPFIAHEVEHLAERTHIIDLLSLLKATQDLSDTVAWYAVLRAPWLGLSLADLLVLAKNNTTGLLWEAMQNFKQFSELSVHATTRLEKFVPVMQHWLSQRQRHYISQYLRTLWIALGGPACYSQPQVLQDIEKTLNLIEKHATNGLWLTAEIEERLAHLYGDVVLNSAVLGKVETSAMVELMTIHKAKGLEFDTVIIPHIQARTQKQDQALLLWLERSHEEGMDLILAPRRSQQAESDSLYRYAEYQIRKKNELETTRLLYVGATRAKKLLHLVAECEVDEQAEIKMPAPGSFLAMLWPCLQESINNARLLQSDCQENEQIKSINKDKLLKRLPSDWQLPQILQGKLIENQTEVLVQNLPAPVDRIAISAGIIFHRVLQSWVLSDDEKQSIPAYAERASFLALKRLGLSDDPLEQAHKLVLTGLENMLADPQGQWILAQSHREKKTEWQLTMNTARGVENYLIDYSFVDHNDVRWIIDYKLKYASQMDSAALQKEIQRYQAQLEKYCNALMALEKRVVRAGLYFPLAKEWVELT